MQDFYQHHIFICTNLKQSDKKCCAKGQPKDTAAFLKDKLKALNLWGPGKVRVSTSGCLGRCSLGPSLVIYPAGVWYHYASFNDLDEIIEQQLLQNKPVKRLLLPIPKGDMSN